VLGKPDPGILQLGAARFGASAQEVLMVGDRLATDVAVGRNAGAWSCHISPGCDYSDTPENLRPHLTCRDLGELHALWKESLEK
jgi:ribonucleotide monophosphatase NagD (HAD superfamily)